MMLVYTGSTLHAGVVREKYRLRDGLLMANFFTSYILAKKAPPEEEERTITEDCGDVAW